MKKFQESSTIIGTGHSKYFETTLQEMWQGQVWSDVSITFHPLPQSRSETPASDTKLRAHHSVLAAVSPVFAEIFKAAPALDKDYVVIVSGYDQKVFHNALEYLYTGYTSRNFEESDLEELIKLYKDFQIRIPLNISTLHSSNSSNNHQIQRDLAAASSMLVEATQPSTNSAEETFNCDRSKDADPLDLDVWVDDLNESSESSAADVQNPIDSFSNCGQDGETLDGAQDNEIDNEEISEELQDFPIPEVSLKEELGVEITQMETNSEVLDHPSTSQVQSETDTITRKRRSQSETGTKVFPTFTCEICHKVMRTKRRKAHLLRHSDQRNHHCTQCGQSFLTSWELRAHEEQQHPLDDPQKCQECGKAFKNLVYLERHAKIHRKPYRCQHCNKGFLKQSLRDDHERTHTGERPFQCPTCNKTFARQNILDKHLQGHAISEGSIEGFKCDDCPAVFAFRNLLTRHRVMHTGEVPKLSCNFCNEVCFGKKGLRAHRENNHVDRLLSCPLCPKTFAFKRNLETHVKRHEKNDKSNGSDMEEKNFTCPFCERKFSRQFNYDRHLKTHTGELS